MLEAQNHPPELDTQFITLYQERMNNAPEKLQQILPYFPKDIFTNPNAMMLSVGAGTGKLEASLAKRFPGTVLAVDYALQMIETIQGRAEKLNHENGFPHGKLLAVEAHAGYIPLPSRSVSLNLSSSMGHEVSSFGDVHYFGEIMKRYIRESARVLLPGGRFILRDFMLPENYRDIVLLEVGTKPETNMDPSLFLSSFLNLYQGHDLATLKRYIHRYPTFLPGTRIPMRLGEALEIMVHYSWSQRLADEAKEQYFYYPVSEYTDIMLNEWNAQGTKGMVIEAKTFLQPDYVTHICPEGTDHGLRLYSIDGTALPLPAFTGIIALEAA